MDGRGTYFNNQWPANSGQFFPNGGFVNDPRNSSRHPTPHNRQQQYPVSFPTGQYISPQQVFQQPHIPIATADYQAQIPFTSATYSDAFNAGFLTSGPVVHEGFIPAPGHEDDDTYPFGAINHRDSLFRSRVLESEDEYDSAEERALAAEEEALLQAIADKDDLQAGSDYSVEEGEFDVEDPDEMLLNHELEDEEEVERRATRSAGSKRGTRGGRRGRPPGRGKGGFGGSASRQRDRGRPKGSRGPRPVADPGPKFKDLQQLANEAFSHKDYPLAIEYSQKAIKLNPEIFTAHNMLSESYTEMGEEEKALEALLIGAPTARRKDLWFHLIDRVNNIDPVTYPFWTDEIKTLKTLDCLRSILLIDSRDYEARSQKLEIESSLGRVSGCVKQCRMMLTIRPHDDDVLKQMARIGTSSSRQSKIHLDKIVHTFDTSIAYFLANDRPTTSNLDWSLLNIYLDLLDRAGDYDRALLRLKTLTRWLQGRKKETYWDNYDDDREYDLEDTPRRITVPEFVPKPHKPSYGKTLPLELRTKMGVFRIRRDPSDLSTAMYHLEMLDPDMNAPGAQVVDYPDLFRDVALALHDTGHYKMALRFFEPLYVEDCEELDLKNLLDMHNCYLQLGHTEKTEELMPKIRNWNAETMDELVMLAKFFEDNNLQEDAIQRGETVYLNGGAHRLQKVGFKAFAGIRERYFQQRKKARGKYSAKKTRVRKYMKKLRHATGDDGDGTKVDFPLIARPKDGLFRAKKMLNRSVPKVFLPVLAETIEGTDVHIESINHGIFRHKLENLASEHPEDLKAARAQHREIISSFKRLGEIEDATEDGVEDATAEFISIARELIEEYSTFDLFYSNRREDFQGYFRRITSGDFWKKSAMIALAVIANNVEDGQSEPEIKERPDVIPQDFYGVHFDKWADVFGHYAILLARRGEDDRCFSTLDLAIQSNIFSRSKTYHHQFELCRIACALALDDSYQACTSARWLMRTYPFSSDLFRMYGSITRQCSVPDGFSTDHFRKYLLRYIKTIDYVLLPPEQRAWYNFKGDTRASWRANAIVTDVVPYVTNHDPALFALFGHVLCCGGSYLAAINYYFRAFTITPNDPLLSLSIGVAYIQHALKRLSENRQYQIQQGLAFVYRYYDLRTEGNSAVYCSEAEFNVGRVWHSLGLMSQAVPAYERCIALSKQVKDEAQKNGESLEDFATEAAFALQTIHALSGNYEGARMVTEEILVIE
ncbi:hypothetical protein BDV95DRAFT_588668 [Massariosphaeria phaeospora]|uniref:TPR-like protein n=1 Tax=Massariosphaeria phaeospora TaxID=100035 RepID=A0A7C8M0Y5_9PLEO|nr:hypothetical protein BDV95DRAFT_588668 [Massariosphaeria phaeospora]